MEVGIEDCLHIEFEYNKSKYGFPYLQNIILIFNFFHFSKFNLEENLFALN